MTRIKRPFDPEEPGKGAETPYSEPELGVVGGELLSDEIGEKTRELQ